MRNWLLPAGLVLAGSEVAQPQRIRLGQKWVRGEDDEVAIIPPGHLPPGDLMAWLRQRAYHLTETLLRDAWEPDEARAADRATDPPGSASVPAPKDDRAGALDALIAAENLPEQCRLLVGLHAAASPRERQVLDLLADGFSYKELPAKMHLTRQAVATLRKRLVEKVKRLFVKTSG